MDGWSHQRRNSLTPTEREVVQITAAVTNGCASVWRHAAFNQADSNECLKALAQSY